MNASKTKTIIVSRSRTMPSHSPPLTIGRTVLNESDDLVILGVTFDFKMTFEKHLRSVSRAAPQRLGILRRSGQVFHDRLLLGRCFSSFVLPDLEYCSAVWCSAGGTPRTMAGLSFPFQYLCGTIFVTPYSKVWDCRVSRAWPMPFYWPCCSLLFVSSCFPFLFFYSLGWYCGAALFRLIRC